MDFSGVEHRRATFFVERPALGAPLFVGHSMARPPLDGLHRALCHRRRLLCHSLRHALYRGHNRQYLHQSATHRSLARSHRPRPRHSDMGQTYRLGARVAKRVAGNPEIKTPYKRKSDNTSIMVDYITELTDVDTFQIVPVVSYPKGY